MILIQKTPNADSRSATEPIEISDLECSTEEHIRHVREGLLFFAELLNNAGWQHDYTKLAYMEEFHEALVAGKIKESKWYEMHVTKERHHLIAKAPKDVTLIDVIEHLTDCVMAGLSRSGEIYDIELSDELLQRAHKNTIEMLKAQIVVEKVGCENGL